MLLKKFITFIWLCWVLIAARRNSIASYGTFCHGAWTLRLRLMESVVVVGALASLVVTCGLSCFTACGDLSSLTRDRTHVPCIARQILNHWLTREVCNKYVLSMMYRVLCMRSRSVREGNGTPPQYSCLENPVDGGAWWAAVRGVVGSQTGLSDFTFTFHFHALEKEMAAHSSVLAWRIPGAGEPGGLPSMGSLQ